MNCLPKELEDIILDYKYQIEHTHKFKKCLEEINKIEYKIEYDDYHSVYRGIRENTHYFYFNGLFEIEQYAGRCDCISIREGEKYEIESERYW